MEDVRSLCPRSILINGGKKLYDGPTDHLFSAYQKERKVTVLFNGETAFTAPEGCEIIEAAPLKIVFMVPREKSGHVVAEITQHYDLADLSVEEEDIGSVVGRIYASGCAT